MNTCIAFAINKLLYNLVVNIVLSVVLHTKHCYTHMTVEHKRFC